MGGLSHTVSGDIASFRTPSRVPIESLKFHFLPKQSAGTPSPENPIPIEGWTGLNGRRAGKNIGDVMWSANGGDADAVRKLSNNYGTSINTLDYIYPNGPIIVTQTKWDNPDLVRSYMNGFVAPIIPNLQRDGYYDVSFKVTNIISNPLNASLSNMALSDPYGNGYVNPTVVDNVVIFKNYRHRCKDTVPNRKHFELRICGMSCTISELMVTPANKSDGVFDPYSGEQIPITFPDGETIYGGYYDPVAGEIVAEYALYETTWGNGSSGTVLGDTKRKGFNVSSIEFADAIDLHNNGQGPYGKYRRTLCNIVPWGWDYFSDYPHYYINNHDIYMMMPVDTPDDTVIQFCALLKTPIHIPIPAEDMTTFLDHNNFWSDANDITEVTYAVTESKDILATRKKAMEFDIGHRKKVRWNQLSRPVASSYWKAYNTSYAALTFEDGIGTRTILKDASTSYADAIRSINQPYMNKDHKYYIRQDLKSSVSKIYVTIIGSGWKGQHSVVANVWTTIRSINYPNYSDDGKELPIWTCYSGNTYSLEGEICQFRNVMFIDLTLMFGLGNEPSTVAEFERICELNGIDLTTYKPYDEGSDRWLIIP